MDPTPPAPSDEAPQDGPGPNEPKRKSRLPPAWLRWIILGLGLVILVEATDFGDSKAPSDFDYSAFFAELEAGNVEKVVLRGNKLEGTLSKQETTSGETSERFRTQLPVQEDPALLPLLREKKVAVTVKTEGTSALTQALMSFIPWVLILGVWLLISRRAQGGMGAGGNPLARMMGGKKKRFERQDQVDTGFADVAGLDSAKRDLGEIIDFLKSPQRFERLGGKMPRGALLVGPPGTGKTLLARAVAGEAGVPFFSITGSEFIELFVGVGASRVRELFEAAKSAAPAIIFIDEIDAVGRSRGTGVGGGHDEREQTLNQLLAVMDGFNRNDRIVVMAATNRPDVLDPALLRPGRFDRRIAVDLPERGARRAILDVHVRDKPLSRNVSLDELAAITPGFSGADLANLVNEATLRAIRRGAESVDADDFSLAHDKIILGELRDMHLSPTEKKRVAVHEAGHALVATFLDPSSPLQRVSIMPRGRALGVTQQTPVADKHLQTQSELEAKLAVLLGGYAAEKLRLQEVSSGAENDLRQASRIAQRMVSQLGMSEELGPVFHEHNTDHPFLGARIANDTGISDATRHAIEREAQRLLTDGLEHATSTIRERGAEMTRLVDALLTHETLEQPALARLLDDVPEMHDDNVEPTLSAVPRAS